MLSAADKRKLVKHVGEVRGVDGIDLEDRAARVIRRMIRPVAKVL